MKEKHSFSIITQNEGMREILELAGKVARSDFSVLLIGETGTGKELFAEYVHRKSMRCENPIVKLGLMSVPPDLIASELFGYEKGAFTSAVNSKKGLFEVANGGSIFLDDIDDVPVNIQTKLLRVLESNEILKIGGLKSIPVNTRLIAASKVNLKAQVEKKLFRADLYYRINVFPINIPPLRQRKDDIPILIEHFFKKFAPQRKIVLSNEAIDSLTEYDWPGNIRELRNITQRFCFVAKDTVHMEHIPAEIRNPAYQGGDTSTCDFCFQHKRKSYKEILTCVEKKMFNQALLSSNGNQSEAARILGLSLSTFRDRYRKLQEENAMC